MIRTPMCRAILFITLSAFAVSVSAQPLMYGVEYRPPSADFLVLESPNFEIIYQQEYRAEAEELARVLELHMAPVAALVGHRGRLRMPVVLRGYNDRANGFVTVRPFKQEIDAVSIKGAQITTGYGSWIEAVAPHELVHALHADARPGGGIGRIIRPFAPDQARAINLGGPSGVNEGIAVWYESRVRAGAGRLNHPHFVMKYRAAAAGQHWSLARMLERSGYTRPFDRHYIGGAYYADYLNRRDGMDSFRRARRMFYRLPFLGYGASMWFGNREAPFRTGAIMRQMGWQSEQDRLAEDGPFNIPDPLLSEPGMVVLSPRWIDDQTLLVHARGYALRAGFYAVDVESGERRLIRNEGIADEELFHFDADRGLILFSRYVPDTLPTGAALAGAFLVDVADRSRTNVAPRGRVHAPAMTRDGGVIALRNRGQFSDIVRLDATEDAAPLYRAYHMIRQLAPRPGTDEIAVLANVDGREGVLRGRMPDLDESMEPWLFLSDIQIFDISWSADGRYLVFSGAPADVSNIYVFDVQSDQLFQATNAPFGALHGAMSPAGDHLAYVNYQHETYELIVAPLQLDREIPLALVDPGPVAVRRTSESDRSSPRPYRAARYLAPRMFSPTLIVDDEVLDPGDVKLGPGFGFSAEGVDPLNRWAYGGHAYYRKRSVWGSAGLSYGGMAVTPSLRVFREPSTVLARFNDGSTRRIGRERRGVSISGSLPLTLYSNVFTTTAGVGVAADYHQERLFDNDRRTLRTVGQQSDYRDVLTVRPAAFIAYRIQSNARDLLPNTGLILTAASRLDVWDEFENPARSLASRLFAYVPALMPINGSVRLDVGLLVQNDRGGAETEHFLPRGYRNRYLGGGTFARAGMEIVQPLAFVDDGSVLIPFYLKAAYGFAAAEALKSVDGPATEFGSLTAGVGLRARLFHSTDVDLRWGITVRSDGGIRQSWR